MPSRYRIRRVNGAPVQLWIVEAINPNLDIYNARNIVCYGRREIDLPPATWLTATWQDAVDWAFEGTPPTPLDMIYPEWCGLGPDQYHCPPVKLHCGMPGCQTTARCWKCHA